MPTAYLNIGSNMGDRHAFIEQAVAHIEHLCGSRCLRSSFLESRPWGFASPHWFINLGVAVETDMEPMELLRSLQKIEVEISTLPHRNEQGCYIDRAIDIDIIAIDDIVMTTTELTLPHPRMHLREFTLRPQAEVAPEWVHPVLKMTAGQMLLIPESGRCVAVGIGEALWDMLPAGRQLGGAPANFAYHAMRQGVMGLAVSVVGNDLLGNDIVAAFDEKGLRYQLERVPFTTGTVAVEVDSVGAPSYDIRENVAWDNIPWNEHLQYLAGITQAVCFGSLAQRSEVSRATINRFIDETPADSLRVFDVNLRQNFYSKEILHESMEMCNILKINDEELKEVYRVFDLTSCDFKNICRSLIKWYNLKMLILTCGAEGSYIFAPGAESFLATPRVDVVDTVGAGDSFTAAFIASLLKGGSIEESHRAAVDVAALVCASPGAMPDY